MGKERGGKGRGRSVQVDKGDGLRVEEPMDWMIKCVFFESLKAEYSERRKELEQIQEQNVGLLGGKRIKQTSTSKNVCETIELEYNSGEDDEGDDDCEDDESGSGGEDSDSEEEDDGDDDCEDDKDDDLFNEDGLNDNIGSNDEVKVHEEPNGSKERPFLYLVEHMQIRVSC